MEAAIIINQLTPMYVTAQCSGPVWVLSQYPLPSQITLTLVWGAISFQGLTLSVALGRSGAQSVNTVQHPGSVIILGLGT